MPVINVKELIKDRVDAIREYHRACGVEKAELDLSGGIDSAVMAVLLTRAIGASNVLLVHTRINTNPEQTARATKLAKALGCPFIDFDLTGFFNQLSNVMKEHLTAAYMDMSIEQYRSIDNFTETSAKALNLNSDLREYVRNNPTVLGSLRSTLRAPIGRGFNRMFKGGIRHGTGNECEDRFLRFYQKGGDGEVDTNPIEMLSKTAVFQLAYGLKFSNYGYSVKDTELLNEALTETMNAKPSPDLWGTGDKHNDEDELIHWTGVAFTYGTVDSETGEVLSYGTIERISRSLDIERDPMLLKDKTFGELLFEDSIDPYMGYAGMVKYDACLEKIEKNFEGYTTEEINQFFLAAKKAEKVTRHKSNTSITTLGSRKELLKDKILTDDLTELIKQY